MHQCVLSSARRRLIWASIHSTCRCCRSRLLILLIVLCIFHWTSWGEVCGRSVHRCFGLTTRFCSSRWSRYITRWLSHLRIVYNNLTCEFWTHPSFMLTWCDIVFKPITIIQISCRNIWVWTCWKNRLICVRIVSSALNSSMSFWWTTMFFLFNVFWLRSSLIQFFLWMTRLRYSLWHTILMQIQSFVETL